MTAATFSKDFPVMQIDCDLHNHMTLGALLRATQQIATDHCDFIGLPGSYLAAQGVAFLLAKMGITVSRDILLNETLLAVTRPCAPRHASYNRYTSFLDGTGKVVAQVDARWILVDIHTRRILRTPPEGLVFPFAEWIDQEQDLSLSRPETLEEAGSACAVYSRVDVNRHLNNTYYGDILCDALPVETWQNEHGFRRAVIIYRQELPLGCQMDLMRGSLPGGWYVEGIHEGKRCFEGKILF